MAKVDDLLQRRAKQIVLAVVARLAHGSSLTANLAVKGIMNRIPKRKKSDIHTRLFCKIDYLLRSNHNDQSIASEFFTGD
jgi:hypothetical protein